ncbi:MAG TPA: ribosome small subunit-dependent GTPase A [Spirochaetota bacterium]|nr:ribosome small subunit-dependent GTPase A [Spirochaetota bacterium]
MNLKEYGLNEFFEEQFARWEGSGLVPGRVLQEAGRTYGVATEKGVISAVVSGHFQYIAAGAADYPAVGDWVLLRGEGDLLMVDRVLERKSVFSRRAAGRRCDEQVIASNIDIMFIVAALDGGRNFTVRGLERYIVMVRDGGARPVIVLNKSDLCTDREDFRIQAESVAGDIPVIMASALTGEGMEELGAFLPQGATGAFTGPSGAGKSSLINALLGNSELRTGELRENDMRGRHTTTNRELYTLSSGAMVIDTPGLRELRPFGDTDSLDLAFTEIAEASLRCRYSDCTHTGEPGCAVQEMVASGEIPFERYQNYITIRNEMEAFDSLKSEKGRRERKAREKELSKIIKNFNRDHKK